MAQRTYCLSRFKSAARWLAVIALIATECYGQISWSATVGNRAAFTGDDPVVISYSFKNIGNKPIAFGSLVPTCPCLSGLAPSGTFDPGASGEIDIEFQVGDRAGSFKQWMKVYLKGEISPVAVLEANLTVKDILIVKPHLLFWRNTGKSEGKTIEITSNTERTIKNVVLRSGSKEFEASIIERPEAGVFQLYVIPKDTDETKVGIFKLAVEFTEGPPADATAFAMVK